MDDVSQPERLKNFAHGLRMCNQPSTQLFRDRINASGIDPKYRKFLEHAFKVYDIGIWSKFWAPSEFEERATNYLVECGRMLKTPDMNKASAKESLKAEYDRLEKTHDVLVRDPEFQECYRSIQTNQVIDRIMKVWENNKNLNEFKDEYKTAREE